ncbi:hypothetical protein XI09_30185 [Bradyrhizobium sp. CCBAU 11386]|uniref:hypothetical protein n=1 Tax=Bradyrhizobium sp. CCBAU 11386 TaxID=1630837 RepID=UPI002303EFC2|nr:hypothetical protein [Bradyrhizobium sp. CCBAU 11386]MDA9508834.1 hypothetical protein [Bradyrhizobium sp. CCBAU 11386]
MAKHDLAALRAAAEVAAEIVLDGYVDRWVEGAIFPCEMGFFLARCIVEDVSVVVESGRQDGYSTEILGDWAKRTSRRLVSIDLEQDSARAAACRQRLAHLPIELVKGSAYEEFGRWSNRLREARVGFLVDGPKGWPAISMMAAGLSDNVRLMAIHNLTVGSGERAFFEELGGAEVFYEAALDAPGPRWQELREREVRVATRAGAARSLEISSLGVLLLDAERRQRAGGALRREFGLHQPRVVKALWSVGAYRATTKLYGLSYRLFRR